ncbi:MAG: adenine phosphoribosyltransferase [Candidatus Hydrogenedentes bacterium]|nr:adenine phosphoribosyltransferase [Candidatus Hydrogenedentota bacterium]
MIDIQKLTRIVPDFPKPGIGFFDITTVLKDGPAFGQVIDSFYEVYREWERHKIVGREAGGGGEEAALSYKMKKGLILVRKPGKLPSEVLHHEYELEYGTDSVEMHKDAVEHDEKVLVIDDLLATGGSAAAGVKLSTSMGANVVSVTVLVELEFLNGRASLPAGLDVFSMVRY